MESSKVRIRPLRFAFLVDPRDKARLQTVFEINSVLWGGCYNFIIPLFKRVPFAIGKLEDLRDFRDREIDPAAEFDPGFSDSLGEGVGTAQRDPQSIW
jgi:hypothetical protein